MGPMSPTKSGGLKSKGGHQKGERKGGGNISAESHHLTTQIGETCVSLYACRYIVKRRKG